MFTIQTKVHWLRHQHLLCPFLLQREWYKNNSSFQVKETTRAETEPITEHTDTVQQRQRSERRPPPFTGTGDTSELVNRFWPRRGSDVAHWLETPGPWTQTPHPHAGSCVCLLTDSSWTVLFVSLCGYLASFCVTVVVFWVIFVFGLLWV